MKRPTTATGNRLHRVEDRDTSRRYFSQVPNILLKLGLTPLEVTLYLRLKQAAWESETGKCEDSTAELAAETGMSAGSISKAKSALEKPRNLLGGKPLITIEEESRQGGKPLHVITLVDIWEENVLYCQAHQVRKRPSRGEVQPSRGEVQPSRGEHAPYCKDPQDGEDGKDTHTARARCSRFDLPMCERYAATLKGLSNPDGYARSIYNGKLAGLDDEKIDAWVSQTIAAPSTRQLEGEPRPELLAGLLRAVHSRVNAESYAQWFEPITQLTIEGDLIRLGVPNETTAGWIKNNYYDVLEESIPEATGKPMRYQMVALTSGAGTTKGAGPIKPNPQKIAASVQS